MSPSDHKKKPHDWLIRLIGVIVPRRLRADWRQEWEAELRHREALLAAWDRLDSRSKLDLLRRSLGAFWDALLLQPRRLEDEMFQDLRYGLRMLLKSPGSTAVAVLSLALGIGANTTIFSFVNALLLRPPAVEGPGQLLEVWNQNRRAGSVFERYFGLSYPDYDYYREHNRVFSGLAAFDGDPAFVSWSRDGHGEMVQGGFVSGNFFAVLGVKAAHGRTFLPEEDLTPGTHPVVVLSHAFWQQHLGADPKVFGTMLTMNGQGLTVVGVAPAGFTGLMAGLAPDIWIPMIMAPQVKHDSRILTRRDSQWILAVGRLKPEASPADAQADMGRLARQLAQDFPRTNRDFDAAVFPATLVPGPFRGYVGAFTGMLMVVVALVLLIACANAANLLLARAITRRREMAIRAALGAGKARLIRQALTESAGLACLGGGVGLLLTVWIIPFLLRLAPPDLPIRLDVPLDGRVLGFTLLVSVLTGIIFGLAPALRSARVDLTPALKDEAGGLGRRRSRLRGLLIVGQVAVCAVLLIAGGLCLRSLSNAQSIDPGFVINDRFAVTLDLNSLGYAESRGKAFFQELVERAHHLPGAAAVSLTSHLPLGTTSMGLGVNIEGYQPLADQTEIGIATMDIGPDYFRAMGVPLLRGREFSQRDGASSPHVIIINEAMAQRYWPGQDPIGRRLTMGKGADTRGYEIIGVVRTGKYRTLSEDPQPFMYRSLLQHYHSKATLVVHAPGSPAPLLTALQGEVRALDPYLAPVQIGTLEQHLAFTLFPARAAGFLLGACGLLGLGLAVAGLYGVVAYSVSQRTREVGVRIALGARPRDILRLVVGQGLKLALAGLGLGIVLALVSTRFLASLLYGLSATDPATFVGVSLLLVLIALVACIIPARRAVRCDPMVALRYE